MKQLKVIVDSYSTSTGLIRASFGEPIILKKGAKLALENFSLDILNITANRLIVRDSTIFINTNDVSGAYSNTPKAIFIPEQVFPSSQDLMNALTNGFNSILNTDYIYNVNLNPNYVNDIGLCFINYLSGEFKNFVNLSYAGVDPDIVTPVELNIDNTLTLGLDAYQGKFGTSWYLAFPKPIMLGGLIVGFDATFFANGLNSYEWGLTNTLSVSTPNLLQYGFRIKTDNELYLVSNGVESLLDISLVPFLNPNFSHQFYVEYGKLRYQIYDSQDNTLKYKTDIGVFSNFNFTDQIFFGMRGTSTATTNVDQIGIFGVAMTYQPAVQQNNLGWFLNPDLLDRNVYLGKSIVLKNFGATPRTVNFDFNQASELRANLGLEGNVKTLNTGITGDYSGDAPLNFGNYFDLALEITNLPLQSWIANTNNSSLSRRVNILSYFTPQRSTSSPRIYLYESSVLKFLSLNNAQDINIESLQFRVYNILEPSVIINCSSMTFNLYAIDETENQGIVLI